MKRLPKYIENEVETIKPGREVSIGTLVGITISIVVLVFIFAATYYSDKIDDLMETNTGLGIIGFGSLFVFIWAVKRCFNRIIK
jgi:uncharacterized membrane protein YccC